MSFYKYISADDRVVSTTNLTEQVIHRSGSGGTFQMSSVKRNYYLEVYSGSSNHTFDVTVGRASDMGLAAVNSGSAFGLSSTIITDISRSVSNYNQLAKILLGNDENGNIQQFNRDADDITTNNLLKNAYFVNFNRGFFKDKIKPGSFSLEVLVSGTVATAEANKRTIVLADVSGSTGPTKRLCQTGEYGVLYAVPATGSTKLNTIGNDSLPVQGLLFYEAGIAVVSPTIFSVHDTAPAWNANALHNSAFLSGNASGILLSNASIPNNSLSASYPAATTGSIADMFQSRSLGEISETLSY